MYDLGIDIDHVKTHKYWSGKNCPRNLLNNGQHGSRWQDFLRKAEGYRGSISSLPAPGGEKDDEIFSSLEIDTSGHSQSEGDNDLPEPGAAIRSGGMNLAVPYLSQSDNWIAPLATCGPTCVAMWFKVLWYKRVWTRPV